ncbi:hypothetical protein Hamer_G021244, partial [Homarus americanus]
MNGVRGDESQRSTCDDDGSGEEDNGGVREVVQLCDHLLHLTSQFNQ